MAKTAEEIVMENLKTIEEWALQGMTQKEMAECLGIGDSTFRKLKKENIALLAVLKKSAKTRKNILEQQVKEVEKSLFERATGYNVPKQVVTKVKEVYYDDKNNKCSREDVIVTDTMEHVPADIQAAKFFLMNRAKQLWQDNPHKVENDKEILKIRKKEAEGKEW